MDSGQHALDAYAGLAAQSRRMVEAAERGEWDELAACGEAFHQAFAATVRVDDGTADGDPEFRSRKAELIRLVLADHDRVRALTAPWLAELGALLGSARQGLLQQSYAAVQGE